MGHVSHVTADSETFKAIQIDLFSEIGPARALNAKAFVDFENDKFINFFSVKNAVSEGILKQRTE